MMRKMIGVEAVTKLISQNDMTLATGMETFFFK